jgi:Ca2+-binding RTX toxin-like protein
VAFPDLVPGATYRWRAVFDPTAAGANTTGALQSFTVPQLCRGLPVTVSIGLGQQPTEGNDVILGTAGVDPINGGGGNDTICAGGGNDSIDGGAGTDAIDGGAGRDNIVGGEGDDTVIGGEGVDTVSYAGNPAGVTVTLAQTTAQNTVGAGIDTISGVENLTGTGQGDQLTGDGIANFIDGGAGLDTVSGGVGNDTLLGGAGDDTITGGPGTDTASYASVSTAVTVNLGLVAAQNTIGAGRDTISGVENLTGTKKGDRLTGNAAANRLNGGAGTDRCDGKAGRDTQVACETRISIP